MGKRKRGKAPAAMLAEIYEMFRTLKRTAEAAKTLKGELRGKLAAYERTRVGLFRQWLAREGKAWCSLCDAVVPGLEIRKLLIVVSGTTDQGYVGDVIARQLHAACPACFAKKDARTGRGGYGGPNVYGLKSFDSPYLDFAHHAVEERPEGVGDPLPADTVDKTAPEAVSPACTVAAGLPPRVDLEIAQLHNGYYDRRRVPGHRLLLLDEREGWRDGRPTRKEKP